MPSIHIQARLHTDKVRESDALAVYKAYKASGWEDRQIVREALIALGEMVGDGWQAEREIGEVKLTSGMLEMLRQMQAFTTKLASLDFSNIKSADGKVVDAQEILKELSDFDKSASDMLGQAFFFDDDEERL